MKYTSPAVAAVAAQYLEEENSAAHTLFAPLAPIVLSVFGETGFEVTADATIGKSIDLEIKELRSDSIFKAANGLLRHELPDALFVSCTAAPIVPNIDSLEREIGIPVVTSSQAMACDALRLVGYRKPIGGFRRLLAAERVKSSGH